MAVMKGAAVVVVAVDLHGPDRPGPLGHGVVGFELGQGLEQGVGQEHADDVARRSGWGVTALTIEPSGATTLIGARLPWLLGMSGLRTERTVNVV